MSVSRREAGWVEGRERSDAPSLAQARPAPIGGLFSVLRALDRFEEALVAVLLLFLTVVGFANVVVRYFTTTSLAFSEELLVNLFVWLSLFGAAIGVRREAHAAVNLLVDRLPPKMRFATRMLAYACSALAVAVLVWQGWRLVRFQYEMKTETYSMSLPMWWFSLGVPLGGLAILLRLVEAAWRDLQAERMRGRRPS